MVVTQLWSRQSRVAADMPDNNSNSNTPSRYRGCGSWRCDGIDDADEASIIIFCLPHIIVHADVGVARGHLLSSGASLRIDVRRRLTSAARACRRFVYKQIDVTMVTAMSTYAWIDWQPTVDVFPYTCTSELGSNTSFPDSKPELNLLSSTCSSIMSFYASWPNTRQCFRILLYSSGSVVFQECSPYKVNESVNVRSIARSQLCITLSSCRLKQLE